MGSVQGYHTINLEAKLLLSWNLRSTEVYEHMGKWFVNTNTPRMLYLHLTILDFSPNLDGKSVPSFRSSFFKNQQ